MSEQVDVIIPFSEAYTPTHMLEEAIDTVEQQSVPTNIHIIEDQNQKGPAWARNKGIEQSSSRFLGFLDADDLWKPDKLERQLETLSKTNSGICVEGEEMSSDDFIQGLLVGDIESLTSSILVDRKTAKDLKFNESLSRFEDHLFIIQQAANDGVCFCEDLVEIRKHKSGLSSEGTSENKFESRMQIYNILKHDSTISTDLLESYKGQSLYKRGISLRKEQEYYQSLKYLSSSMKISVNYYNLRAFLALPIFFILDKINID